MKRSAVLSFHLFQIQGRFAGSQDNADTYRHGSQHRFQRTHVPFHACQFFHNVGRFFRC
jgi:hypothetical protein